MEALQGKNGIIQYYKNGDYRDFACCESVDITINRTKKSVKTVGDGNWDRFRTKSKGFTINCSGLIPWDTESVVHAFDLLQYLMTDVDIQFQIVFSDDTGSVFKVIRGTAGVDNNNITSPLDFVGCSISLTGNGPPEITTIADVCVRTITGLTSVQQSDHSRWRITVQNISGGQVGRYDYSLDGGADQTNLGGDWYMTGITIGTHQLRIWPVCDNGVKGDLYTVTITRTT